MLKLTNLHAGYGKVEVLHGISLEVPKGQVVTLIGSNGAGKTTTMRAISGMIAPREGQVLLGDVDITGRDSHRIARLGLAHSPEGRRVFATMSVTDNLLLGAFPRFTGARKKGDVAADVERGGGELLDQQHRHALGAQARDDAEHLVDQDGRQAHRGLVKQHHLGVHHHGARHRQHLLLAARERARELRAAFLQAREVLHRALDVADYGYVLENGRIAVHGPAAKLKNDPAVQAAYLGGGH